MLEDTVPTSLWASMNSWLTPPLLFLLLNLMIATIAYASSQPSKHSPPQPSLHTHPPDTSPQHPHAPDTSPSSVPQRLGSSYNSPDRSQPSIHGSRQIELSAETEPGNDDAAGERSLDEVFRELQARHVTRTRSETEPASGDVPERLPAKMRKSASMKSAIGHFEEIDAAAAVEARRPETTKEGKSKVTDSDDEVDAKADDFINRFKHQLKLQRIDSIVRYKEMIGRGGAR